MCDWRLPVEWIFFHGIDNPALNIMRLQKKIINKTKRNFCPKKFCSAHLVTGYRNWQDVSCIQGPAALCTGCRSHTVHPRRNSPRRFMCIAKTFSLLFVKHKKLLFTSSPWTCLGNCIYGRVSTRCTHACHAKNTYNSISAAYVKLPGVFLSWLKEFCS